MAVELIEFWATGCQPSLPCHAVIEQLSATNDLAIQIRSVDAWDAPLDIAAFRVLRLPTLVLRIDGTEAARWSPTRPSPSAITAWVVQHLPQEAPLVTAASR